MLAPLSCSDTTLLLLSGKLKKKYYDDNDHHLDHHLDHLLLDRHDLGDCHAATRTVDPAFAGQLPE